MTFAIVVHGGAGGWSDRDDSLLEARLACEEAAAAGRGVLTRGGSALDAVEAAVKRRSRLLRGSCKLSRRAGIYSLTFTGRPFSHNTISPRWVRR